MEEMRINTLDFPIVILKKRLKSSTTSDGLAVPVTSTLPAFSASIFIVNSIGEEFGGTIIDLGDQLIKLCWFSSKLTVT